MCIRDSTTSGLESVDLSRLTWDTASQSVTSANMHQRIDLYGQITSIIGGQPATVCNSGYSNSELFKIKKRIGSESTQGEVYLVEIGPHKAALKIMPYLGDKHRDINQNEITIAKLMSSYVLNGKSANFPSVYFDYHCNDVKYSIHSAFYNESYRYGIINAIINFLTSNSIESRIIRRIKINLARVSRPGIYRLNEYIEDIITTSEENFPHNLITSELRLVIISKLNQYLGGHRSADLLLPVIECDILISELAQMDLKQFIQNHLEASKIISNSEWSNILRQVTRGIRDLLINNVIHNDLHMGNVLCNNGAILIHDFGKSEIMIHFEKNDQSKDIVNFISNIISYPFGTADGATKYARETMSVEFYNYLEKLHVYILEKEKENDPEFITKLLAKIIEETALY